jgi:hypothetical protein
MSRLDTFLDILRDPEAPSLQGSDPLDEPLLGLLLAALLADDKVSRDEFGLLRRLMPGATDDQLADRIHRARSEAIDLDGLEAGLDSPIEKRKLVVFVEQILWADLEFTPREDEFLRHLTAWVEAP